MNFSNSLFYGVALYLLLLLLLSRKALKKFNLVKLPD